MDFSLNRNNKIVLDIDRKEVLRYLGCKKLETDRITNNIIESSIEEINDISDFKYIFNIYDIDKSNNNIYISNSTCSLNGNDIYNHLKQSEKCVIMAVTLGVSVDKKIKYYSNIDITRSVIMDACATASVENLCDSVENIIKEIASDNGYYTTRRFSPGYGDFPIESQFKILDILKAQTKIGLTVTDTNILISRKSITAIIGLNKDECFSHFKCDECKMFNDCTYSKKGENYCDRKIK